MRKEIEELELTDWQLEQLAHHTCQWWNAVLTQGKRFIDALQSDHGKEPWDKSNTNNMFVAERIFFITAIHHAIEYLQKLNIELQRADDWSLQNVLEAIEEVAPLQDILSLRNMNEHGLEYLLGKRRKQKEFISTAKTGDCAIKIPANMTFVHGGAQVFLLGNVPIDKLLSVMREQLPVVYLKTKGIHYKPLSGE